jgi:hypothetical protein
VILRGLNNVHLLDVRCLGHRAMPRPTTTGSSVTTGADSCKQWLVPGELARLMYESPNGHTWLDLEQRAAALLFGRGDIVSGEGTMAP